MNFMEAVKAMKEGKKVRRQEWNKRDWCDKGNWIKYVLLLESLEATDWEIYKEEDKTEQDEAEENMEKIKKALKFVGHLENHAEVKNAPVNAGIPMCKICDKTIDEIYEGKEEDNWNLADESLHEDCDDIDGYFARKDIKTFIQKVKEDVEKAFPQHSTKPVKEIINKRAGDLQWDH